MRALAVCLLCLGISVKACIAVNTSSKSYQVTTVIKPPFVMRDKKTGKWSGFCIDLMNEIGRRLDFEYTMNEVPDKQYGHMDDQGKWNGMLQQLIDKRADMALSGLQVSAERRSAIDFTIPIYDNVGISIVRKKPKIKRSLLTFISVLDQQVWALIIGSYLCTSILMYLFDKYSPYSNRNSGQNTDSCIYDNQQFTLKECLWFCINSLTSLGGGEAPINLSGQLVAATWWLFGFIIIATYTADSAVHFTQSRMVEHVASLHDLSMQFVIKYSAVCHSPEHTYFQRMASVEKKLHQIWKDMSLDDDLTPLQRSKLAVWDFPLSSKYIDMFELMATGCPENMEQALIQVRKSETSTDDNAPPDEFALIAEANDVKYLVMTDCDLMEVGQQFSSKPYAIGLQKNSPLKKQLDDVIYSLIDDNFIEKLKVKWWDENPARKYCSDEHHPNHGMDIGDVGGVFIALLIGIGLAYAILVYEYYLYRKRPAIPRANLRTIHIRPVDQNVRLNFRRAPTSSLDLNSRRLYDSDSPPLVLQQFSHPLLQTTAC